MGYGNDNILGQLADLVPDMIQQALEKCSLEAVYQVFPNEDVVISKGQLNIQDKAFHIKNIIWSQIKKLDTVAIVICTLGASFDQWAQSFSDKEDELLRYIADTIGSELVEKLSEVLLGIIEIDMHKSGRHCSNNFSPGYCGWAVKEQHELFSFFSTNDTSVRLSESALMHPIKSISGIIAIGNNIEKKNYICNNCEAKDCYKRW